MRLTILFFVLLLQAHSQSVPLDRIAIVIGRAIIKDSDIDRQVRFTQFLNQEPLRVTPAERKKAAAQLVDQIFLRNEIREGSYPYAEEEQSDRQLETLQSQRFHTQAEFDNELKKYSLDEDTLRLEFRWQLTVLSFIDARFKPAVVVPDAAVDAYYKDHITALRKDKPKGSVDELRSQARDILIEQEVNRLFFTWLDDRRKSAKINYHEDGLA